MKFTFYSKAGKKEWIHWNTFVWGDIQSPGNTVPRTYYRSHISVARFHHADTFQLQYDSGYMLSLFRVTRNTARERGDVGHPARIPVSRPDPPCVICKINFPLFHFPRPHPWSGEALTGAYAARNCYAPNFVPGRPRKVPLTVIDEPMEFFDKSHGGRDGEQSANLRFGTFELLPTCWTLFKRHSILVM